jgi:predicted metalloprotease with PDZ domain
MVDLKDIADDQFKVALDVAGLSATNNIYQFASTAPGTYQVMNIGRFVTKFKAFDKKGVEVPVTKIGDNQYELSEPKKVARITYNIAETWDTPVDKNVVYKMCGSSLEKDNVLINGQCVFGYLNGMQGEPLEIRLDYPESWLVGTSLAKNKAGNYYAETYDRLVDSPILLGQLTKASTMLGKVPVDIYTYSKTGLIKSADLMNSMENMLKAANAFIGGLPVDRYTFLFHFEDESWGAWEHSYGSEYVLKEQPFTPAFGAGVVSIAAHEFFHVVTPLNIHSEIVGSFNFVTPTPSEHLWLYEGTTEWASDLMQLRYGLIDLPAYFEQLKEKLIYDGNFDQSYSLSKLSLTSYTDEGQAQYGNIYMRGALVAGLLDIRLLELSGGKKGLREIIREVAKKYGPNHAFPEHEFFTLFTSMTYPEIAEFFENYVKYANPLPIAEYYAKLGIKYTPEIKTGKKISLIGITLTILDGKLILKGINSELQKQGLLDGDELKSVDGAPVTLQNVSDIIKTLGAKPVDTEYTMGVDRASGPATIHARILSKDEVLQHVFEVDPAASEQQVALRNSWLKNF